MPDQFDELMRERAGAAPKADLFGALMAERGSAPAPVALAAPPAPVRTPQERQKIGADYIAAYLKAGGNKRNLQSTLARVDWNDPQQVEDMRAFVERETGNREAEERAATPALPFRLAGEPMRVLTGGAADPARMGEVLAGGSGYGVDRARSEAGVVEQIATGIAGAPGQILKVAPTAGALKAIGLGRAAFPAAMGAVGAGEAALTGGDPLKAGVQGLVQGAVAQAIPVPNLARNIVTREAVARGVGGLSNVVSGAVGRGVTGEGTNLQEAGVDFGMGLAMPGGRTEVPGRFARGRAKVDARRADRAYTAAEQRAGMVDPARPEAEAYREAQQEAFNSGRGPLMAEVAESNREWADVRRSIQAEAPPLPADIANLRGQLAAPDAPPPPGAPVATPPTPPPADPKGLGTGPKRRGRGMGKAKPPKPATMAEASQIKQEFIQQGGPIDHVASKGRVKAFMETGQLPEPKVLPDGTVEAGYDPQAREKGLIEPGAMPAVDAAEAAGVKVVSSGVDKQTGEGYAVGRAPDGQVVEVRAPSPEASAVKAPPPPADPAPVKSAPPGDFDIDPATGLPNYLSKVKVTAPKVKPMPRSGEAGAVAVPETAVEAAKATGKGIGWISKIVKRWFGKASESVRGLAGDAGDKLADDIAQARTRAADYEARHTDRLVRVQRATRRGPQARRAQMPAAETEDGASLYAREIIEGRAQPQADEAPIYDETGALLAETWNDQDRLGFKIDRGEGKVPMGQIKGPGRTLPDAPNQFYRSIIRKGGDLWETVIRATQQKHKYADPEDVRRDLEQKREDANQPGVRGAEGHMASEYGRKYSLPDFIRVNGELVPIQETNLFNRATSLVKRGADVVGMRQMFSDEAGESTVAERRKAFEAFGADEATAFDRAMRTGYGINPFHSTRGLPPMPSSLKGIGALSRGLALTGSPIYNTPDIAVGNQAKVLGYANNLRGIIDATANTISRMVGRGETERMRGLEAKGFRTRNVTDWSLDPHAGKIWGAITGAKGLARKAGVVGEYLGQIGKIIKAPASDAFNQWQEDVAASAAERFTIQKAKEIVGRVSGGRAEYHVEKFQQIGLTRADAEALVSGAQNGTLTPDQVVDMLHRAGIEAVSSTTSSNMRPSATSLVEQLPGMRQAFMFIKYPMTNLRLSGRALAASLDGYAAAYNKPGISKADRAKIASVATAAMGEFVVRSAIQGVAFKMFAGWVMSIAGNEDREQKAFKKDPTKYVKDAIVDAMAGGPVTRMVGAVDQGALPLKSTVPYRGYETWRVLWNTATADLGEAMEALERTAPAVRSVTGGSFGRAEAAERRTEKRSEEPPTPRRRGRGIGRGG